MYLSDAEEAGLIDVSNKRWWIGKQQTQWSTHRQEIVLSFILNKNNDNYTEKRWQWQVEMIERYEQI